MLSVSVQCYPRHIRDYSHKGRMLEMLPCLIVLLAQSRGTIQVALPVRAHL
jgi:hypothetical protein